MFKNFFITLIFGLVIGLSTALYVLGLEKIQIFHQTNNLYPYFLLPVFIFIIWFKRHTLFFPTTVHEVVEARELDQKYWSRLAYPANIMMSWFSHAAGASLGREGTSIVLTAHLLQFFKINWNYFKPIVIAATFGCVVNQPLISVIILMELFVTNFEQKIFTVLMSWIGVLVLQSFQIQSLFHGVSVDMSAAFSSKLSLVILLGLSIGLVTRAYKKISLYLYRFFKQYKWVAGIAVIALTGLMLLPLLKPVHSLSLAAFQEIQNGQVDLQLIALKIIFTLLFTTLGFIGGDFVPSIIIGAGVGVWLAECLKIPYTFGLMMGLFSFFTGVSRLKWTSLWMIFLLAGFVPMLWAYWCLSLARYASGPLSFYRPLPEVV